MKNKIIRNTLRSVLIGTLLFTIACNQDGPVSSVETQNDIQTWENYKKDRFSNTDLFNAFDDMTYMGYSLDLNFGSEFPLSSSATVTWASKEKFYNGAFFVLGATKSSFFIERGSLTPPINTNDREAVEITYEIDKDEAGDLIFTFGPSGCAFDPPATVTMDFAELEGSDAKLYYIENDGTYTEQAPDDINYNERWLSIQISHFSRYAVAYGR